MEQMISLWSMVMVDGLMVAGSSNSPILSKILGLESDEAREHLAIGNQM